MSFSINLRMVTLLLLFTAAMLLAALTGDASAKPGQADSRGLERAHAHNDYEHDRPLFDALDNGFKSVEADVWLIDGELVVSHDDPRLATTAQPKGTLESLYLEPLRERVKENGGNVYRGDPDYFTLLVDIKSEAGPTYEVLHEELESYRSIFTTFKDGKVEDDAVTAIVSGNRPRELMEEQRVRHAAYDGRIPDDLGNSPQTFVPLVSQNWTRLFTWQGVGPMPEAEREKLRDIVATAHANGQRVRFWATPELPGSREAVWGELLAAQADYINTDNLDALEQYLLRNDPRPTEPNVYWNDSAAKSDRAR